ncbi:MAG: hypothetical protein BAA03_06715 [Caldibacillus debilis]|nr:MAG: hypothetical protein BAA03_06715 [Caldibacillus debilis]
MEHFPRNIGRTDLFLDVFQSMLNIFPSMLNHPTPRKMKMMDIPAEIRNIPSPCWRTKPGCRSMGIGSVNRMKFP